MLQSTESIHLPEVAKCHIACFPDSLSSRLGRRYVEKTLEWFLINPQRFLFHVKLEGKIAGFCGGFVPQKFGDGSSSGMLQFAFNEAIIGLFTHPQLLFHPEVRQQYKFLWLNIKRKFTGKVIPISTPDSEPSVPNHVGLVVIGVDARFRGTGVAKQLAEEFEKRAKEFHRSELVLSVKANNSRAIAAYTKFGWSVKNQHQKLFVMHKFI